MSVVVSFTRYESKTSQILHVKVNMLVTENVKDATELHYGECRSQCFWSLELLETKSASAALIMPD